MIRKEPFALRRSKRHETNLIKRQKDTGARMDP